MRSLFVGPLLCVLWGAATVALLHYSTDTRNAYSSFFVNVYRAPLTSHWVRSPTDAVCSPHSKMKTGTLSSTSLYAEMRILIYGSKNAYTTIRPDDLVLYSITPVEADSGRLQTRALGLYTAKKEVLPLYVLSDSDKTLFTEFHVDTAAKPLPAKELQEKGQLLRIVSADKHKGKYRVTEFLDEQVFIDVRDEVATVPSSDHTPTAVPSANSERPEGVEKELVDLEQKLLSSLQNVQAIKQRYGTISTSTTTAATVPLQKVATNLAPAAVGPYSQAVICGSMVYLSGCVGIDPAVGKIVSGGVEAETLRALKNMEAILTAAGSSKNKVCKTTVLLKDMDDYATVNKLYSDFFSTNDILPARTCYAAAALPIGALIEIEATASL